MLLPDHVNGQATVCCYGLVVVNYSTSRDEGYDQLFTRPTSCFQGTVTLFGRRMAQLVILATSQRTVDFRLALHRHPKGAKFHGSLSPEVNCLIQIHAPPQVIKPVEQFPDQGKMSTGAQQKSVMGRNRQTSYLAYIIEYRIADINGKKYTQTGFVQGSIVHVGVECHTRLVQRITTNQDHTTSSVRTTKMLVQRDNEYQ